MLSTPLTSSIFTFPEITFTSIIGLGRIEAEALTLGPGFEVWSNPHASNHSYLEAVDSTAQAGGVFQAPNNAYDLPAEYYVTIGYFDETDGVSNMELLVNGEVVDSFVWDSMAGTQIVTKQARAEITFHDIGLKDGDVIELRGGRDGGEPLRTDYIEIQAEPLPFGDYFRVEAEDFNIAYGFSVVRNNASSERYMLQHTDGSSARAELKIQYTGSFDINVVYYDETDGVSSLDVGLNNDVLASLVLDWEGGDAIASPGSTQFIKLTDVALEAGDVFHISGSGDRGEPLRIDFIDLTLSEPPAIDEQGTNFPF